MNNDDIDFQSIYKSLDRQIFLEKLVKNIFLWLLAILFIGYLLAGLLGYIDFPDRCRYDETTDDYICWDPRS